jgi:hypothetical protein
MSNFVGAGFALRGVFVDAHNLSLQHLTQFDPLGTNRHGCIHVYTNNREITSFLFGPG